MSLGSLRKMKRILKGLYWGIVKAFFPIIFYTKKTAAPVTIKQYLIQKVFGINRKSYWPTHFTSRVIKPENIKIGLGTAPGLSPGCYIQGVGKICIGDYTIIGPNVGIISANHDSSDSRQHNYSSVRIGKNCWVGMNSVILPGVSLANNITVGAGSVVTKSFDEPNILICGNPAKKIKNTPNKCLFETDMPEYYGYIQKNKFKRYSAEKLNT